MLEERDQVCSIAEVEEDIGVILKIEPESFDCLTIALVSRLFPLRKHREDALTDPNTFRRYGFTKDFMVDGLHRRGVRLQISDGHAI